MSEQGSRTDQIDCKSESGNRSEFADLKIALQVMSHDGVKLLIPILSAVIGIGTCAGLLIWSFGELQNFSPDSIAVSRVELPVKPAPAVVTPPTRPVVAARPQVSRKPRPKVRKPAAKAPRRLASSSIYQDYYFSSQDDPTNGRVIRSNEACTEYSWNTKKTSGNRHGFRLAN
jgi:hypothetical protein